MINEFNPEGKEIRFIDSHYNNLFKISDGSCVQIHYPNETVIKPCKFIDEYHTQVGYNVFHICQFAEIMERNSAVYMAEPEIMDEEAAWRVGKDRILAIQTCEDGYDYTLFDENYNDVDGGQIDNPDMTMLEVRRDILESYNLENRELRVMVYDEVMEQALRNDGLPDFVKPENYLKNAEMAMEDDYGMLDGVINNGKVPVREEKLSVLEQLKELSVSEIPRIPSKNHTEREIE